jgi:hypothetical protein
LDNDNAELGVNPSSGRADVQIAHRGLTVFAWPGPHHAGATFRAVGLQSAMTLVVPLAIALTCVSLFFAARSFIADARKMASVGQRIGGLAAAS